MALPLGALGSDPAGGRGGLTGAAGGLTGAVGGGGGTTDSLGGVTGLADGLVGGGDPLGSVSSLAGGLTGSGAGLNLVGLVGVGSDDPALVDVGPAEKKQVKAEKAAIAAKNQQKREAAMQQLRNEVKKQGSPPTPEQRKLEQQLLEPEDNDRREMQKLEGMLGPTDPELYRAAMEADSSGSRQQAETVSPGLVYAYLVDSRTHTPTHMLTFANATTAEQWYRQASTATTMEKASPQMYLYDGAPPRPSGKMACIPIQTVQPVILLQRADGYPICCKPGSGTGTSPISAPVSRPAPPPPPSRKKLTFEDVADSYVERAKAKGDPRSESVIHDEAMADLRESCRASEAQSGTQQLPMSGGLANGTTSSAPHGAISNPLVAGGLGGPLGGLTEGPIGGSTEGPLGGLTGGLLPGSQGLNVAGISAIGSDEKAALDLAPGEKKEQKARKANELRKQQVIQ